MFSWTDDVIVKETLDHILLFTLTLTDSLIRRIRGEEEGVVSQILSPVLTHETNMVSELHLQQPRSHLELQTPCQVIIIIIITTSVPPLGHISAQHIKSHPEVCRTASGCYHV